MKPREPKAVKGPLQVHGCARVRVSGFSGQLSLLSHAVLAFQGPQLFKGKSSSSAKGVI